MVHGPKLAVIAWRNLWRNRRRTLLTLFGIAFGVMLAILFTGLGDSTYRRMIDYAARMGAGHVTVQHRDYLELPSVKKTILDVDRLADAARRHPEVVATVPRISGAVMLATAGQSYAATFIAVDPARETPDTLEILEDVSDGGFFDTATDKGIILGSKLAENLGADLGNRVVYTLTDKHGEIVSGLARVRGIVRSGAPSLDSGLCLLPIGSIRETLSYAPTEATQLAVFLRDNAYSDSVATELGEALDGEAVALSWKQTQADLYGFISMKESSTVVFEMIILLLIGAGIFNSLFVSVMERLREFGVMIAIGFSEVQVFSLVMWESLWMALAGLIAAAVVTAGPYYHLSTAGFRPVVGDGAEIAGVAMESTMYVEILPVKLIVIAVVVLVATLASGLYPAWKAGRAQPVDAIKLV